MRFHEVFHLRRGRAEKGYGRQRTKRGRGVLQCNRKEVAEAGNENDGGIFCGRIWSRTGL